MLTSLWKASGGRCRVFSQCSHTLGAVPSGPTGMASVQMQTRVPCSVPLARHHALEVVAHDGVVRGVGDKHRVLKLIGRTEHLLLAS